MGIIKTPLIIFLIYSILYTRAASHRSIKKNRRFNDDGDASKNCFCFPKSLAQAPIRNIIDPDNNGLERLVVYLYKDSESQVIKMYAPAKEKQKLIPDIPFESGDTLDSISTESIAIVFNSNSNKINVTQVAETENQSEIETESHESSSKENKYNWLINNEISDTESIPFAVSPSDLSNQYHEILSYQPIQTETEEISDAWTLIDYHNIPYGDINDLLPAESQPVGYNEPIDSQSAALIESSIINSTIFNFNKNVNSKTYITFDKWFANQMAKFNALNGPTSTNTIEVYVLKALMEEALQENNIYVSVGGVLTDAHGAVIDYSNLMLRPILIGDLVAYQHVLKETNKFQIPTNSPYLKALLITLVNPPKVIGIIPLGLDVLPSQSSSSLLPTIQISPNDESSADISNDENSHSLRRKLGKYGGRRIIPGYLEVPNKDQNSPNIRHTIYSNRKAPRKNLDLILQKSKANKLEKDNIGPKAFDNEDESIDSQKANRPKIKKILENFYRLLTGAKKENKDKIDNYDSFEDDFSEDVDEKHNFRIIGGNAATSSGTPLNNKGRSGIIT